MDEQFSKRLNEMFFHNKRSGFFIEAGAMSPDPHSVCKWFEVNLLWKGINVEPLPRFFNQLVEARPNCININCALSSKAGKAILVEPLKLDGKPFNGRASLEPIVRTKFKKRFREFEVELRTYSSIIKEHNIKNVDLFVLDVEGHELEVIKDFKNSKVLPHVLTVETNKVDKNDVARLLNPLGYKLDWYNKYDSYFVRGVKND